MGKLKQWAINQSYQNFFFFLMLLFLGSVVILPFIMIFLASFESVHTKGTVIQGWDLWIMNLKNPVLYESLFNTIKLVFAHQLIAWPFSLIIAWLIGRTDLKLGKWMELIFAIGFFIPALPITLGWILLLDPDYGIINKIVELLPFVDKGFFNIYSFWGMVWVHLTASAISIKVILLTPAFRNMNSSLEEASRISGDTMFGSLRRIVLPLMSPAIITTAIMGVLYAFQSFEIELFLGTPIKYPVFSTQVYNLINTEPPSISMASVISLSMVGLMISLIVLQSWLGHRKQYTVVNGKYQNVTVKLGKWKWPAFLFVSVVALFVSIIPILSLVIGTFMQAFGFFNIKNAWTLNNWKEILGNSQFFSSFLNTLRISLSTAIIAMFLYGFIAYIIVRTSFFGRKAIDFLSWLPIMLPGIILGFGFMWSFLSNSILIPFYGTFFALVLVSVVSSMSLGVQMIKSNLVQISKEFEEAARMSGSKWWKAYKDITLPLMMPILISVGTLVFIISARDVSNVVLLATINTRPLSLLQLDYMMEGHYESAAIVGTIIVILTVGLFVVGNLFKDRK